MTLRTVPEGFCLKRFGCLATDVQKWSINADFTFSMSLVCDHAASEPLRFGRCKLT